MLMMGYVFAVTAMNDGMNVTYLPSYGAEVRGGTANCTVVVSDEEIFSPVASTPDYAVIMNQPSLIKYEGMIREQGSIFINSTLVNRDPLREDLTVVRVPANQIAKDLGSDQIVNMILLGAFVAGTQIVTLDGVMESLKQIVKGKRADLMKLNRLGLDKGAEYVSKGGLP